MSKIMVDYKVRLKSSSTKLIEKKKSFLQKKKSRVRDTSAIRCDLGYLENNISITFPPVR